MVEDFKSALARIQSDYEFYIGCQTDPGSTLAGYDLTPRERSALSDPDQLAALLEEDLIPRNLPSITIKISGTHDWVNRSTTKQPRGEPVIHEVSAVKAARSHDERRRAALRLIERIG